MYNPIKSHITTKWIDSVNINSVLEEYPRPQLRRKEWTNLNGIWKYQITDIIDGNKESVDFPKEFNENILVPFGLESSLSGVAKHITDKQLLWYKKQVHLEWKGKKLIHFGAVDYEATVYVNRKEVFKHIGGYSPFEVEINETDFELIVKVWDPTDSYDQPRGKQVNHANGIWYTPITGIWQTVWVEPVHDQYIDYIQCIPNIDCQSMKVLIDFKGCESDSFTIDIIKNNNVIISQHLKGKENIISLPSDMKYWTPDTPELYDVKVSLDSGDSIFTYFGYRKFSKGNYKGFPCFELNNKPIFVFGYLDQGYWPDGLYTAPTDEALKSDILFAKSTGINLLRKHAKTESARWYYHCDTIGIIVWQDMPSRVADTSNWNEDEFNEQEKEIPIESKRRFINEWNEIRKWVGLSPCVGCWIPFNESWGQFNTKEICELSKDEQRLVNDASGGNHFKNVGDICDCHSYPKPRMRVLDDRIRVVGEYGGIGKSIPQHTWIESNWGYIQSDKIEDTYEEYIKMLVQIEGLAGAIYTQLTDVETEVNGLLTYDRAVVKIDVERIKQIHQWLYNQMK
ncbi:hypothetical protein ENUP19_0265G0010 [Entamoeba nuttalli]|uniref:Beta-galactosidase, putative n=2 Tax=Entamoeba nuttalli TaxID=412467 RepID=K2G3U9_ENTNP|nr:beta-galactosidase, putative [Entamoeba nuttalli P19]EKE36971.1 beta-galactosidase, putative [Entamoeba nuttalli P19]|eukprot:XP_008860711.1 beta-galactosidase, putative [Entamoeba nuttalli P19]